MATSTYSSSEDQSLAIYYARNIKAGPNTVTVSFGGGHPWRRILVAEYQGIDPINPVDVVASNQGSASTAKDNVTSGVVGTTLNGDLMFGAVENFNVSGTVAPEPGLSWRSIWLRVE
jgi:uridylate kinase